MHSAGAGGILVLFIISLLVSKSALKPGRMP
jgi:hypothetical protein